MNWLPFTAVFEGTSYWVNELDLQIIQPILQKNERRIRYSIPLQEGRGTKCETRRGERKFISYAFPSSRVKEGEGSSSWVYRGREGHELSSQPLTPFLIGCREERGRGGSSSTRQTVIVKEGERIYRFRSRSASQSSLVTKWKNSSTRANRVPSGKRFKLSSSSHPAY